MFGKIKKIKKTEKVKKQNKPLQKSRKSKTFKKWNIFLKTVVSKLKQFNEKHAIILPLAFLSILVVFYFMLNKMTLCAGLATLFLLGIRYVFNSLASDKNYTSKKLRFENSNVNIVQDVVLFIAVIMFLHITNDFISLFLTLILLLLYVLNMHLGFTASAYKVTKSLLKTYDYYLLGLFALGMAIDKLWLGISGALFLYSYHDFIVCKTAWGYIKIDEASKKKKKNIKNKSVKKTKASAKKRVSK